MKKMTLIEMNGFLKGKCIPRDLKVNETNAEYLVRKFGELESKLETALRECRSAGITIDNLEAKCATLAADNEKAMEEMRQADAAVKLAHEKLSALAAENAALKESEREFDKMCAEEFGPDWISEITETPATDARHSNTRAAADIYFQLVEECEIPAGGSLVEYVDDMREKLEAAEKRIAELELREVVLPQCYSMLHRVDFDEPYHAEMVYRQHHVLEALHNAGINVTEACKGEAS